MTRFRSVARPDSPWKPAWPWTPPTAAPRCSPPRWRTGSAGPPPVGAHPGSLNGIGKAPFADPLTSGSRLRLWRDADGQLQANGRLIEVRWHDTRGRLLDGPVGPGPWLVHATSADGRTTRQRVH